MKLTKLATVVALSGALTLLIVGVVSAAPAHSKSTAASSPSVRYTVSATTDITDTDDLTQTEGLTSTTHFTQPVAVAISFFFSATYSDVISLHNAGFGFGVIARAFFIANLSQGSVTPQQVLDLAASGTGWGQIMKQYDFKPSKGNNLGAIMSGHGSPPNSNVNSMQSGNTNSPGKSGSAPGRTKAKNNNVHH
jgi:hypothetical protein